MTKPRIAVIGKGNVGSALARGLEGGYTLQMGTEIGFTLIH
jgi:predicted dinucleotide-binding enzyme